MGIDLTGIFNPEAKTIRKIFGDSDSYYQIPDYQRPYSWDTERVEQLFDDIYLTMKDAVDPNTTTYFLGPIILIKTKEGFEVVDGQQRLTALTILFCVFRDLYANTDNQVINSVKSLIDQKYRLRLITQLQYQNKFEQEILEKIKLPEEEPSLKEREKNNFLNTVLVFKEKLAELSEEERKNLLNFILDNVVMITITCTDKSYAIKLFQILNARGLDLNAADLIKSYLYGKCQDDTKRNQFIATWRQIEDLCEQIDEKLIDVLTYYTYYLLAKNPEKSVYEELEAQFKSKDPNTIVFELKTFVDKYNEIQKTDSKLIYSFYYLQNQFYWKAVLSTAKIESFNNFDKLSVELQRLYYLYWIAGYTSTRVKQITFNIIGWIKDKKDLNFIKEQIELKIKKDKILQDVISAIKSEAYGEPWLRPLLVLIEYNQTDNSKVAFIELDNKIHVDHILPEKWSAVKEWREMWNEQQAKYWLMRIGNLTLLSGKKNISQQNDPPSKKKEMYKKGFGGKTAFEMSKQVIDTFEKEGWNENHVEERQTLMLTEIGKVFCINPFEEFSEDENEILPTIQTKELYDELEKQIMAIGTDVKVESKKHYIAFKRKSNFATLKVQQNKIKIWVKLNDKDKLEEGTETRDVSEIGHHGTGDTELILDSNEKLLEIIKLIKKSYDNELSTNSDSKLPTELQKQRINFFNDITKRINQIDSSIIPNFDQNYSDYCPIPTGFGNIHFEWCFNKGKHFAIELHLERNPEDNKQILNKIKHIIPEISRVTGDNAQSKTWHGKAEWESIYIQREYIELDDELKTWAIEKMKQLIDIAKPELNKLKL